LSLPDIRPRAPPLLWLRRGAHQLIKREPMVVDRVDSPEGVEVRLSMAPLLLLTVLVGSAIMSFELLSVYEAGDDRHPSITSHSQPMSAEAIVFRGANGWVRTDRHLPPIASDFWVSHMRVAR
jgi:hypothetical protein